MSVGKEVGGKTVPAYRQGCVEMTLKSKQHSHGLICAAEGGYEFVGRHAYNPSLQIRENVMESFVSDISLEIKTWCDHRGSFVFCSKKG